MPHEDRRIIFDYSETYKAIYALCVQKEMRKPPPGAIAAISLDPADDQKVRVRIENKHDNTEAENEYTRDFMAAALMLFCRSHSIPLAKKAKKLVEFGSDHVMLRIVI